jgi:hypothetical protein
VGVGLVVARHPQHVVLVILPKTIMILYQERLSLQVYFQVIVYAVMNESTASRTVFISSHSAITQHNNRYQQIAS